MIIMNQYKKFNEFSIYNSIDNVYSNGFKIHQYTYILSQLQNIQFACQLAVKEASTKLILQEFYTCFINTNLDICWRCDCYDETVGDTVETDAFVLSKHYCDCARINLSTNDMKLYNNDGKPMVTL